MVNEVIAIAAGVCITVSFVRPTEYQMKKMDDPNTIIDQQFSAVQQDIIRFIRHCAMRNGVTQDYVQVAMQTVLDNQIIKP